MAIVGRDVAQTEEEAPPMTDIDPALLERARTFQTDELKLCDEDYCTTFDGAPCDCIKAQIALARFAQRERLAAIEQCAKIADDADDCKDYNYDNGFTKDGYEQAKRQIASSIRAQRDKGGA